MAYLLLTLSVLLVFVDGESVTASISQQARQCSPATFILQGGTPHYYILFGTTGRAIVNPSLRLNTPEAVTAIIGLEGIHDTSHSTSFPQSQVFFQIADSINATSPPLSTVAQRSIRSPTDQVDSSSVPLTPYMDPKWRLRERPILDDVGSSASSFDLACNLVDHPSNTVSVRTGGLSVLQGQAFPAFNASFMGTKIIFLTGTQLESAIQESADQQDREPPCSLKAEESTSRRCILSSTTKSDRGVPTAITSPPLDTLPSSVNTNAYPSVSRKSIAGPGPRQRLLSCCKDLAIIFLIFVCFM